MLRVGLIVIICLFAVGCNTVPKSIQGDYQPLSVQQARELKESPMVRWGGVIAKVDNQASQSVIEIVAKPLDSSARPRDVDASGGRFLAIIPEFIDPMVYQKGREITVVGQLSDMIEGKVGDMTYLYPVVRVSGHYLWKKRPLVTEVHYWGATFWPPFPYRYYYSPHWRHFPINKGSKSKPEGSSISTPKQSIERRQGEKID
jgi:outer membrane lipoprotein